MEPHGNQNGDQGNNNRAWRLSDPIEFTKKMGVVMFVAGVVVLLASSRIEGPMLVQLENPLIFLTGMGLCASGILFYGGSRFMEYIEQDDGNHRLDDEEMAVKRGHDLAHTHSRVESNLRDVMASNSQRDIFPPLPPHDHTDMVELNNQVPETNNSDLQPLLETRSPNASPRSSHGSEVAENNNQEQR